MSLLERIIGYLVPTLRLHTTPWLGIWKEDEKHRLILVSRFVFAIAAVAYLLHIQLDRVAGLTPAQTFLYYRLGLSAASFALFALSFTQMGQVGLVAWASILGHGVILSVLQAQSMVWNSTVPFFFCAILPFAVALVSPLNMLLSIAYTMAVYFLQFRILADVQFSLPAAYSLEVVTLITLIVFKSRQQLEVINFLNTKTQLETQKALIEAQQELNHQVRAFLPAKIFSRFETHIKRDRMTVLQAIDSVLQPKLQHGVCSLFSDIREFTKKSKDSQAFLGNTVLENIRRCTDAVESHGGIPRLIGDLIFAYFDEGQEDNLRQSLSAAFTLIAQNKQTRDPVNRYCLLSIGSAYVGNIGGLDSSREITAMGTCINKLSRVDELTKNKNFRATVALNQVLCTDEYRQALSTAFPDFEAIEIPLAPLGLKVRDFEEETTLWVIPASPRNIEAIRRHVADSELLGFIETREISFKKGA